MLLSLEEEGSAAAFVQEKVGSIAGEVELMLAGGTPLYELEVYCMEVSFGVTDGGEGFNNQQPVGGCIKNNLIIATSWDDKVVTIAKRQFPVLVE